MTSTELHQRATGLARPEPLYAAFLRSAKRLPRQPALEAAGETLTYAELEEKAKSLAATLARHTPAGGAPVTAVFSYRTPTAFAGVLGSLLRGHAYVALNRRFPPQRSRLMLEKADARALVVDTASAGQLEELLHDYAEPLLLVLPEHDDVSELQARLPRHLVLGAGDLEPAESWAEPSFDPDAIAYLIFTSGSTGTPKAVMVPHTHIRRYLDLMVARWRPSEADRFSQTFDMTFDLSVTDMFVCWEGGATLCCPTAEQTVKPAKFIIESRITVWYAVPSAGLVMKRLGMLKPGRYPGLRLVLACGEALPVELAQAWAEAAPKAVVENVYGPTEATITCAVYTWDPERSPTESEQGVVPIGRMYEGMEALVLGEALREVSPGEEGELYLAGPQVTPGYWRDSERTAAAFVTLPGRDGIVYKTGDLVRRPVGEGPLTYHGRVDYQVKISGHRVELGEIEAVLRRETRVDEVVVLGWPRTDTGYAAVTAFVRAGKLDTEAIRERIAAELPDYMVPREIRLLDEMPLNVNGKFDRKELLARLEAGT